MNGLQSERFYRVEYKVVSGSGTADETVQYFDENHSFKVVRLKNAIYSRWIR